MQAASIRAQGLDVYMRATGRHRLLTAERERELARQVQAGSESARDELVVANLRLVVRVARQYGRRGLDLTDLISEGNLGLIHAVEKFDPDAGCRFSTYAVWWIAQGMRRALERSRMVRVPSNMMQRARAWQRAEVELQHELGRRPADSELADRLELSAVQTRSLGAALGVAAGGTVTLDSRPGDEDATLREMVRDPGAEAPEDAADRQAQLVQLARLLPELDERSRHILEGRFGLGGGAPRSLVDLGAELGLTRERVRQLEQRALSRLAIAFRHGAAALRPRKRRTCTATASRVGAIAACEGSPA